MPQREITLEEYLSKGENNLSNQKLKNLNNIDKILQRINESDGEEKTRLENLLEEHYEHRDKLNSIDYITFYTEKYNKYFKE